MKLGIIFAIAMAAFGAFGQPAVAAKPVPSGTISVAAGSELYLGGVVTFDWSVDNIANQNPRIEVDCYQGGVLVYAEAHNATPVLGDPPFDGASFLLGGGGSAWKDNGGPAECVGILYYWDFHPSQTFVPLAEVAFSAGG
jgi:hypothetical protein